MFTIPIMYTQSSNQSTFLSTSSQQQQPTLSMERKQQFSFNCEQPTKNKLLDLRHRYQWIYNKIRMMDSEDVIDFALEKIEEIQSCKSQLATATTQLFLMETELTKSQSSLTKKTKALHTLCSESQKNLQLIQKLERKLSQQCSLQQNNHYKTKYEQLSTYMNQYISTTNLITNQYQTSHTLLQKQNSHLRQQLAKTCNQLHKKQQQLSQLKHQANQFQHFHQQALPHFKNPSQYHENYKEQLAIYKQPIKNQSIIQPISSPSPSRSYSHSRSPSDHQRHLSLQKITHNKKSSQSVINQLQQNTTNSAQNNQINNNNQISLSGNKSISAQYNCRDNSIVKENNQNKNSKFQISCGNLLQCKSIHYQIKDIIDIIDQDLNQQKTSKQLINNNPIQQINQIQFVDCQQNNKIKQQFSQHRQQKNKKQGILRNLNNKVLQQLRKSVCNYTLPDQPSLLPPQPQKPNPTIPMNTQQSLSTIQQKQNIDNQSWWGSLTS